MRRTTYVGAALAGLTLALTACSGSSSGGGTATGSSSPSAAAKGGNLLIWADNSANTAKAIQPLCEKWAAANGVTCTVKLFNGGQPLQDALTKGNATGAVPDIFEGPHNGIGSLVSNGILAPIDLEAQKANFIPASLPAVTYNGNTYGVPWAVENVALMTNTSLASTCPATMDDAVSTAKSLIASKKATKGLGIAMQIGTTGDAYHWYSLFTGDGGYSFGQKSDGSFNPADLGVGNAGSIAAGTRLAGLVKEGVMSPSVTFDIARASFAAGKSPYFITGPWEIPEASKALGSKLKICPIPAWTGDANKVRPFLGVRVFMQPAKAPDAVLASTFLTDEVMTTDFMEGMFKVDPRAPAWIPAESEIANDPIQTGFSTFGKQGIPMPNIPQMDAVFSDLGLAEYKIASGTSPASALKQARAAILKTNSTLS